MSQHRKVLVFKDVNYGASKSSTTQNTALNPADLADGAVGVYAIHKAGSTNLNKLVLITDGGSEAAGSVPVASLVTDEVYIAMGTPNGVILSNPIQNKQGIHELTGKVYTAPVKGVSTVGYTSGGGLLNYPSTIVLGDLLQLTVTNRRDATSGDRSPYYSERYSVELIAGDTVYTALRKLVNKMHNMDTTSLRTLVDTPKIVSNGTGAAAANSATLAAVQGATTLTSSAAHGIGVLDYVIIGGDYYQAVTGTTGTTLVLDRPYTGVTATIANANFIDAGATIATQFGLEVTDANFNLNTEVTVQGVLQNSTVTKGTLPLTGSGTYEHVLRTEKEFRVMLGTAADTDAIITKEPFKAVSGTTYDMYIIGAKGDNYSKGAQGSVFKVIQYTMLFFPVAADTANKGQSDFEDIMQTSTLFGTTFPSISA